MSMDSKLFKGFFRDVELGNSRTIIDNALPIACSVHDHSIATGARKYVTVRGGDDGATRGRIDSFELQEGSKITELISMFVKTVPYQIASSLLATQKQLQLVSLFSLARITRPFSGRTLANPDE